MKYILLLLSITIQLTLVGQINVGNQHKELKNNAITKVKVTVSHIKIDSTQESTPTYLREIYDINKEGYVTNVEHRDIDKKVKWHCTQTYKNDTLLLETHDVFYNPQNQHSYIHEYVYNKNNILKKWKIFFNGRLATWIKHFYRKDGKLDYTRQKLFGDPKYKGVNSTVKKVYSYNSDSNLEKITSVSKLKNVKEIETYEYEYSENGTILTTYKREHNSEERLLYGRRTMDTDHRWLSDEMFFYRTISYHFDLETIRFKNGDVRKVVLGYNSDGLMSTEKLYKNDTLYRINKYEYLKSD